MVIIQTKGDKKHEKQHQNVQGSIRFLNIWHSGQANLFHF
jgi:hypothetical protein